MSYQPSSRCAIVLQLPVLYRRVVALTAVMQRDSVAAILGDGEANRVGAALGGNPAAMASVANIAEVLQFGFTRRAALASGGAVAAKAGAQGQPPRKRPVKTGALFGGEKIRASHSMDILVPMASRVLDFFVMTEPNRLEMLSQFLEQNPNDAFARYGLALEYSKLGQIETALQQFNKLLELHPDYTGGYFMAAQTLAKAERNDEAKAMLQKGIESAKRTGNRHALSEMTAMLDELS